jgi:hypothetical protein
VENSRAKNHIPLYILFNREKHPARVLLPAGVMSKNNEEKQKKNEVTKK